MTIEYSNKKYLIDSLRSISIETRYNWSPIRNWGILKKSPSISYVYMPLSEKDCYDIIGTFVEEGFNGIRRRFRKPKDFELGREYHPNRKFILSSAAISDINNKICSVISNMLRHFDFEAFYIRKHCELVSPTYNNDPEKCLSSDYYCDSKRRQYANVLRHGLEYFDKKFQGMGYWEIHKKSDREAYKKVFHSFMNSEYTGR